jgi:ABC-2 type transport system permease protein
MAAAALEELQKEISGAAPPVAFEDLPLGASGTRTEFEGYVPGLLVFAVVMLIFQAAMLASREVEKLTLRRLAMSRMTTVDFLGGITLFELLMGMASAGLTLATALACGFGVGGNLLLVLGTIALTALSVIGLSLVLAAFARSALEAFIIANIPLAFLMFFSGAMFPLPRLELASFGAVTVGLFDFLPPTHGVNALNKLFSGAGLGSIAYECISLLVLSAGYFALGVALYRARRMQNV